MTLRLAGYAGQSLVSIGKKKVILGESLNFPVPQDMLVKEFIFVHEGKTKATFSGGTAPRVRTLGVSDGIVRRTTLQNSGTDKVKSFSGLRKMKHNSNQVFGLAAPSVVSLNASDLSAATQGETRLSTTSDQYTSFAEAWTMMMENKLSNTYFSTLYSTLGLQTAAITLEIGSAADIQDPEDALASTWSYDGEIEIFASCADHLLGAQYALWVETSQNLDFSGAVEDQKYYLQPEDELQGVLISGVKNGKVPFSYEDMRKTIIEVSYDGARIFKGSMLKLAMVNNLKTMKQKIEKGSFYWNFLNNSTYDTGLKVGTGSSARPLEVTVTLPASIGFTTPASLVFEYDKIIRPRVAKTA